MNVQRPLYSSMLILLTACGTATAAPPNAHAQGPSKAKQLSPSQLRTAAYKAIDDDPKLPRVLLIGDSITMGCTLPMRELLKGKANVHYPKENCGPSRRIVERIDQYLGDKPWDVIEFNCGIHDVTLKDAAGNTIKAGQTGAVQVPIDEYEANLEKIVARLKKTGATLLWRTTTPVAANLPHRKPEEIDRYNAVAERVMKKHGVEICAWSRPDGQRDKPMLLKDGVHFTVEGCREMARDLAPAIERALKERADGKP